MPEDETLREVDEGLQEVFEAGEVDDFEAEVDELLGQYRSMSSGRWHHMTEQERQEYLFEGLD